MNQRLMHILENFKGKKIIVLGDIMLDKYIWGNVSRISPEAPVQVVKVLKETFAPGGAANVANNIVALGSEVFIVGIVGDENPAEKNILLGELNMRKIDTSGIFTDAGRPTTLKVRILGKSQQLLRVDYEKDSAFHASISEKILRFIESRISSVDAIVVSDYAKGVVNPSLISNIISLANQNKKIFIVDPKPKHRELYKNVTLITPNHNEAVMMAGMSADDEYDLGEIGSNLVKSLGSSILLTKGEKGMTLFEKNGGVTEIPAKAREVYDVVGAGDTVVAAAALALSAGATLKEAAVISNIAAGIKVGKVGTSTVSIDEIRKELENEY